MKSWKYNIGLRRVFPRVFRENTLRFRVIMFGGSESRCIFAPEIKPNRNQIQLSLTL